MSKNKLISIEDAIRESEGKGIDDLETISFYEEKQKRTEILQTTITPSEKEVFFSMIGRKTASNAIRELILNYIKNNK